MNARVRPVATSHAGPHRRALAPVLGLHDDLIGARPGAPLRRCRRSTRRRPRRSRAHRARQVGQLVVEGAAHASCAIATASSNVGTITDRRTSPGAGGRGTALMRGRAGRLGEQQRRGRPTAARRRPARRPAACTTTRPSAVVDGRGTDQGLQHDARRPAPATHRGGHEGERQMHPADERVVGEGDAPGCSTNDDVAAADQRNDVGEDHRPGRSPGRARGAGRGRPR